MCMGWGYPSPLPPPPYPLRVIRLGTWGPELLYHRPASLSRRKSKKFQTKINNPEMNLLCNIPSCNLVNHPVYYSQEVTQEGGYPSRQ
jgi:hypothetical protein